MKDSKKRTYTVEVISQEPGIPTKYGESQREKCVVYRLATEDEDSKVDHVSVAVRFLIKDDPLWRLGQRLSIVIANEDIASIFIRRGLARDLADALAERIESRPDLADRVRAGDHTLRAAPMSGNWPEDDGDPNEVIVLTAQTKSGSAAVLIEKLSPEQMRDLVRAP